MAAPKTSIIASVPCWPASMFGTRRSRMSLHFMGRSTWRSGEAAVTTAARDAAYRKRFAEKWGASLTSLLLPGVAATELVRSLKVEDWTSRGDYLGLIQACLDGDPHQT